MIQPKPAISPDEVEGFGLNVSKDKFALTNNSSESSQKNSANDHQQKCLNLKAQFDKAEREVSNAEQKYYRLVDEVKRYDKAANKALENLRESVIWEIISFFIPLIRAGKVNKFITKAKKKEEENKSKREVDWFEIAGNAWDLYNNSKRAEELAPEVDKAKQDWDDKRKKDQAAEIWRQAKANNCEVYGW